MLSLLVLSSCVSTGRPPLEAVADQQRGTEIVVGAFNFSESAILGQLYGRALRAEGLPVKILGPVAPREVLAPALEQGVVDIVPEYQGTALTYWSFGQIVVAMGPRATHRELEEILALHDLVAAGYASVENKNEVVVPRATADKYELRTISDLETVAPALVFGGPRECPERPQCLPGLERIYDLAFAAFQPLDAGGPLTTSALEGAEVDAAVMFTTDPNIAREELVILDDDRNLQPSENVVPVLRREVVERYGERVLTILDEVTASLKT
ncbi:MAG: glycine betaine ABC transporter substrate-binding protein, partial [Actinomycetota bacterium]